MSDRLSLTVVSKTGRAPLQFQVRAVWNGGWSSRDLEAVRQHAAELAHMGVPAPTRVPIYFPLTPSVAVTAERIEVLGAETSGEIEYALLFAPDGEVYVTVASDHSDRAAERHGIQLSKQLCPDVLAPEVWPYSEVAPHWDQLVLRCWVTRDGQRQLYQEAALAELLSAEDWLRTLDREHLRQPGLIFLSGTPPTIGGLVYGDSFEIELQDPVLERAIRHRYAVDVLGPGVQ
jgi:2-keto-4-pentenoate hydratase/2-oxohepta-3-ene-1,7-dioic acid hydratase in catechol pathway